MREAFFGLSTDWKEGINWANVRDWRLKRAHAEMEKAGLGALLLFYDENMRYVSSTLTPGWNRLKPGLKYVVLPAGKPPIVYEQGDIGFHLEVHNPWIPKENIRHSYVWIKGAVGPAADQQVNKFVDSLMNDLENAGVKDMPIGVDFIDINLMKEFEKRNITWTDGMTPMMNARAIKSPDEIKATVHFSKRGLSAAFTTRNRLQINKMIEMRLVDGPFRHLQGFWRFEPIGDAGCKIHLDMEFEIANPVLRLTVGPLFQQIANSLMDAFVARARDVHGG